ncbi:hypothetical protein [Kineococcus sp. NPDC059986]
MRKRLDAIRFWLVLHKPMIVLLALMVLIPALFGGHNDLIQNTMGY